MFSLCPLDTRRRRKQKGLWRLAGKMEDGRGMKSRWKMEKNPRRHHHHQREKEAPKLLPKPRWDHSWQACKRGDTTKGQFHQCSTRSFYGCKLLVQLFCAEVLGFYFTGVSLPAQKLHIERWWNWAQLPPWWWWRRIVAMVQRCNCNFKCVELKLSIFYTLLLYDIV